MTTSITIDEVSYELRPTFAAMVSAEEELGPIFSVVERAGAGKLKLSETTALFWHCIADKKSMTREMFGEGLAHLGLAACAVPLKKLLGEILQGGN